MSKLRQDQNRDLLLVPNFEDDESDKVLEVDDDIFRTFDLFIFERASLPDKVDQRLHEVHVTKVQELVVVGRHQPLERVPQEDELERPGQNFWREI